MKKRRLVYFVFGCVSGALAMLLWLRTPGEADAATAPEPSPPEQVAPNAPATAPERPATLKRERRRSGPPTETGARRSVSAAPVELRREGALEVLSAIAPALGRCLPDTHTSVPLWLRVSAEGKILTARFGREISKDAATCARRVLEGQTVAEPGPVEELFVELSLR